MTKVKPNNGNETKSDIFPQGMFKSDTMCKCDSIFSLFTR